MAQDYNQQNPDGSWWHVHQDDNGNYTHTVIAPSSYGAAGIPGGGGGTPSSDAAAWAASLSRPDLASYGQSFHDQHGTWPTLSDIAASGYSNGYTGGDPSNPYGTGTSVNIDAGRLAEEQVRDAANAAYQQAIIQGNSDRLAFDKATQAAQQTLETLKFAATLTGPANAFEYAKALNGTPGGMADIVNAANGGYRLPATGGGNQQPIVPLSLKSILDDIQKYAPPSTTTPGATSAGGTAGTYQTVNGAKTLAQMQAELRSAGWGGNYDDPNAVAAAYAATTKSAVTPSGAAPPAVSNQVVASGYKPQVAPTPPPAPAAVGNQITVTHGPLTITHTTPAPAATPTPAVPTFGNQTATTNDPTLSRGPVYTKGGPTPIGNSYVPQFGTLPHPNQIDPQNWQSMVPSQQQLLLGAYADQGWKTDDVLAAMQAGLRGYSGPSAGSVGF